MLPQDYDLSREDVQLLASRDALAAFFAKLGYDSNVRLMQNVNAMGITGETLRASIKHIERLANREALGLLFEVYLFELKSVTVAVTQAIARGFRDRSGDYLLVLTSDYQELDFVLVQRYINTPSQETPDAVLPSKPPTVSVQPRILTLNRLKPEQVALRVLRRFSYTEAYPFQQYDKLLSAYEVAEWSEPFFNNRALFSDYYLTKRLPEESLWNDRNEATTMTAAFKQLRQLYADVRETFQNQPESVIRTTLFELVFTTLGFAARPVKASSSSELQPDYQLYARVEASSTPTEPLALCLTYTWGRNLDGRDDQRDSETSEENPGAVVVTLLDEGQADWAIVTNGKIWRLYSAKAHSRATNYYEIDLEETLALPAANLEYAFRYFWLFFRAAAFIPGFQPDPHKGGHYMSSRSAENVVTPLVGVRPDTSPVGVRPDMPSFLDNLISESERYARELGERLKERIFFEIFPHFAEGFILHARQTGQIEVGLESMDAEQRNRLLEPYFSGTLTFLYRLLFLLYAESRDLLPVREQHGYYPHSLEHLKREIAKSAGNIEDQAPAKIKAAYHDLSTTFYDRLQALFHVIDKGDTSLNVPVYNGGLFVTSPDPHDPSPEAEVARFLATHKIPDRHLALGLDRMARDIDTKRHDLAFIDYKSLGVRQLGSIYEGLLEFKLRIAPEEMAVVKGKKTEEVVPYAEARQKKFTLVREGRGKEARDKTYVRSTVYLANDRSERKATGSYYTPDYIVKYIVEHTVGPVLQEKLDALRPLFREAEQTLKAKRDRAKALRKQSLLTKGDSPENETYNKYRDTLNLAFFDLKVLDPAMGSGHFLVEAVDYITDQMAKFLTSFRWNPIIHELAETRRDIQTEMERQSVTVDMSKLTDINLLKRQVLKRCIYGVDLNLMAVELAKVSLWLDCFTLGAPLSFLDHHMKVGNSLIGGSVQEVQKALSGNIWGNQFTYLLNATELMRRVGSLSDITAQEVAESRKAYQGAYDALAPFKRLLDVWTSEYFGNNGAKRTTQECASAIVDEDYSRVNKVDIDAITTAQELAKTKHFFHWELEFPEVFYDAEKCRENGGFDAVVGNPPYVRQEGLGDDKNAFKAFYTVFNSIADLYTYFIERGNLLLRRGGRFGMITANKFMRANYGAALRSFLTSKVRLEKLIDFGELRVFGEAATDPLITLSSNEMPSSSVEYIQVKNLNFERLDIVVEANAIQLPESAFSGSSWSLVVNTQQTILDKMKVKNIPLEEYVDGKIQYGVKTGFNDAFVISQTTRDLLIAADAKSAEIIKPLLIGDDVRRYYVDFKGQYLIFTRRGIDLTKYKAIEQHLSQYRTRLEPKPLNWDNKVQGEWQGRKSGPYKWYEIQDNVAYYADFEQPKIIYPDMSISSKFAFDEDAYYTSNTTYIIPTGDKYLLALLNSRLIWTYLKKSCSALGNAEDRGRLRMFSIFVELLPIRRITFTTPPDERARLLEKAKNLYTYCLSKNDQACVLGFVDHHLSKEPQESDVVHDLLAFLAEEMIRLNKEKRAIIKAFLDWLVATLSILPDKEGRIGIDVLTGKSRLTDYPGDYQKGQPALAFGELLEILQKNKSKLGVKLVEGTSLLGEMRGRYEENLERVLPLKEQLSKTDRLIDAVVYRLYGLTEDEIKIVEGKA